MAVPGYHGGEPSFRWFGLPVGVGAPATDTAVGPKRAGVFPAEGHCDEPSFRGIRLPQIVPPPSPAGGGNTWSRLRASSRPSALPVIHAGSGLAERSNAGILIFPEKFVLPTGRFSSLVSDGGGGLAPRTCGVRVDGTVECWGECDWWPWRAFTPEERFSTIDAGEEAYSCGSTAPSGVGVSDGWKRPAAGSPPWPPVDPIRAATVSTANSTAGEVTGAARRTRRSGGSPRWLPALLIRVPYGQTAASRAGVTSQTDSFWSPPASSRPYSPVTATRVVCAPMASPSAGDSVPRPCIDCRSGPFTSVAVGLSHLCGLRSDGTVICWGDNDRGQAEAPGGRFTALTAGDASTCGLRPDGPIVCWGELPAIRPPVGVKEGESDPGVVRVLDKPTTRQIAYTSADLDDPGVFVIDADGSDERQLTLNDRVSESPAWSPDGTRIAFSSERDDGIVVMDADGRRNKQLTEQGGRDPAWSPDGTSIAFTRDGQVFVVSADGTDERQQTTFRSVRILHEY